jgi:hypothetical protein
VVARVRVVRGVGAAQPAPQRGGRGGGGATLSGERVVGGTASTSPSLAGALRVERHVGGEGQPQRRRSAPAGVAPLPANRHLVGC